MEKSKKEGVRGKGEGFPSPKDFELKQNQFKEEGGKMKGRRNYYLVHLVGYPSELIAVCETHDLDEVEAVVRYHFPRQLASCEKITREEAIDLLLPPNA